MRTRSVPVSRPYIAVVGGGIPDGDDDAVAEQVGRTVAEGGAVVVCGGMSGVMEAACRGAKSAGGTTVGILPGLDREDANPHVDVAIPTGLGEMRNALVVRAADAVVAVGGEYGTLSEVAFALKTGVPVVGVRTWTLAKDGVPDDGIFRVDDPTQAAREAVRLARQK
jgi:uncharacterized protein (TIGR00725 family)